MSDKKSLTARRWFINLNILVFVLNAMALALCTVGFIELTVFFKIGQFFAFLWLFMLQLCVPFSIVMLVITVVFYKKGIAEKKHIAINSVITFYYLAAWLAVLFL